MMRRFGPSVLASVTAVLCLASASAASANTILLNPAGGSSQVDFFEKIGQSFTAEDSLVSVALFFREINPSFPNDPIQYDLYAGSGVGGTLIATTTFSLANGFEGFFDFNVSSTPLLVGNVYSLVASIPGNSPKWGVAPSTDNYLGGDKIVSSVVNGGGSGFTDEALRVTPLADTGAVPEPASMLLIGSGLAGLVARRRTKRQHAARLLRRQRID